MSIELVKDGETLIGMIIRATYSAPGVSFLTDPNLEMQVAAMNHPKGKSIIPHIHQKYERHIHSTSEVLILKKGRLRVDFYNQDQKLLESREVGAGDLLLLTGGAHGFEVLEDLEMYEVKQGPFAGEADKKRFQPESSR